jgi:thiosulfate/3-mercaptopyruvate sulfurtransferase
MMIFRILAAMALFAATLAPAQANEAPAGWHRLVTPQDLVALQAEGPVRVLDIRAPREYATAHVAGAINAPYGDWRGPDENPGAVLGDPEITVLFQRLGITYDDRIVVTHAGVDDTDFGAAARVYWTLKSAGLTRIAILNGGVRNWVETGLPLSVQPTVASPSTDVFMLSDAWMATREQVAAVVDGSATGALIDARPRTFYEGRFKHPAAKAAGTLPGAQSVAHSTFFDGGTTLSPTARITALADAAQPVGSGANPSDVGTISFCNTGHWAATTWFALSEIAGQANVRLYPESTVGWTNAGGRTVNGE